jgi:hypothetical protein
VRAAQMRGRLNTRSRQNTMRITTITSDALKLRSSQFVDSQSFHGNNRSEYEFSPN